MRASTTKAMLPFRFAFDAARSKQRRRRNRSRLHYFASIVASDAIAFCRVLLWALQDSRSREAARVMEQYRHLRQDFRDVGDLHFPNDAGTAAQQTKPGKG